MVHDSYKLAVYRCLLSKDLLTGIVLGIMKKDIHPKTYRKVVFEDITTHTQFIISSTIETDKTESIDGTEYPKVIVEVSSQSHPFYTGNDRLLDKTGRVERFKQRALKRK